MRAWLQNSKRRAGELGADDASSNGERISKLELAQYGALYQRLALHEDLQWRTPVTVMTVESFVYLGLVTVNRSLVFAHWLIAGIGFALALVGAVSMRRHELRANGERIAIDVLEQRLREQFLFEPVRQTLRWRDRVAALEQLTSSAGLKSRNGPPGLFFGASSSGRIARTVASIDNYLGRVSASASWFALMVLTGLGALALAAAVTTAGVRGT